ncbi:MAG: aldehyde dehydrogenase family protein, partial [Planctomycetota bacterium]
MVEEHKNYIDGQWVESESGRTFEVHNPARLSEVTGRFPLSSEQDVDRAIRAAKKGFSTWTEFSPQKRAGILKDARQLMKERREEIAQILTRENGKTLEEARGEIDYALSDMEFQIAEGMRMAGETMPVTMSGVNAYSIRVAVGIVGVITPWNFPFNVPTAKCVPALASGCAVIFKPASQTSHTGIKLVELFEDAGVPEGVINCVLGSGREVGNAIASDPRMDAITFTGSTEVGRTINALAAENLVRTQLEMGGKNGVIVLKDADIEAAVSDTISAAFGTSGQKCTATSRAIVVDEIADEFVEKLLEGVHSIRVGEGTEENVDIGPVTGKDQL